MTFALKAFVKFSDSCVVFHSASGASRQSPESSHRHSGKTNRKPETLGLPCFLSKFEGTF